MMNDGMKVRLFFALPAQETRSVLMPVFERLNGFHRALKTIEPDNYHITLKFLGGTKPDTLDRLRDDFRNLDMGVPALPFTLRGLGAFPDVRRARVIWCGLDLDMAVLEIMRGLIEDLSATHGFAKEIRAFEPHLTLARVRKDMRLPPGCAEYITAQRDTAFGAATFDRVVLFKSELRKERPLYTALEEKRLG